MGWAEFKDLVVRKFCPLCEKENVERKFLDLRMKGAEHREYTSKFYEYSRLVPHLVTPASNAISKYIYGLVSEIRDNVKSAFPQTLESAVEIAGVLTEGMVRTHEEKKEKELAEKEIKKSDKPTGHSNTNFSIPKCSFCKRRHKGSCDKKFCNNCKIKGHTTEECRRKKGPVVCYHCNEPGHFRNECPKLQRTGGANQAGGQAPKNDQGAKRNMRAFALNAQEAAETPDVITGMFPVNNIYARVLFDSGANQSFIDYKFCQMLKEPLAKLEKPYQVETANGDKVKILEILNNGRITLSGHDLPARLLPMALEGFDIILGMDWFSTNRARIVCNTKSIEIRAPNGTMICIRGDKPSHQVRII